MKTFLVRGLTWLFPLCLVGCGDPEQLGQNQSELLPADEPRVLSVLTWRDYLVPELVYEFGEVSGVQVSITEIDNSEQLQQLVETSPGEFDVTILDEYSLEHLKKLGLLAPLRRDLLENLDNISGEFLGLDVDPENEFSAPYLWGLIALAYRRDLLGSVEPNWSLLWDDRVKGRVGLLDEPRDMFAISLLAKGIDPGRASPEEIGSAGERLFQCFKNLRGRMNDFSTSLDRLASGDLLVGVTYNGDGLKWAEEYPGIKVVIPSEGAPIWVDSFAVCRDAQNPVLANEFIDFMLSGRAAAESANWLHHASPNREARPLIDGKLKDHPALYPSPSLLEKCRFTRFSPEGEQRVRREIVNLFDEVRLAGIRPIFAPDESAPINNPLEEAAEIRAVPREN